MNVVEKGSLLFFFFLSLASFGQKKDYSIPIQILYDGKQFESNSWLPGYNNHDSVYIERTRFYLTNIAAYSLKNKKISRIINPLLVDLDSSNQTLDFSLKKDKKFHHIGFTIGVDSSTNSQGAFGGDLDPTNGMYWSWQSGYINFKLEGMLVRNGIEESFTYHLGGYSHPFNSSFNLQFSSVDLGEKTMIIELKNLIEPGNIMQPSMEGVVKSQQVVKNIRLR
ncbi:MAG: hypothetical protein ACI9XP_000708 [Lentimonas sp.]|jgi:hypothetical protein